VPGPAGKLDPVRRNARVGPLSLPAEGRTEPAPSWPLPSPVDTERRDFEVQLWAELWATPQACAWATMGAGTRREVARYVRLCADAEFGVEGALATAVASMHSQATALSDRLGLTPKAMRLLLWEVTSDEVAGQRAASSTSARGRIKAV
jgi:hypothetical protein